MNPQRLQGMVCACCGNEIGANHTQCQSCASYVVPEHGPWIVEALPCGHPVACVVTSTVLAVDDGEEPDTTNYCGWCEDVEVARGEGYLEGINDGYSIMDCGHPVASLSGSADGDPPLQCDWCADMERVRKQERNACATVVLEYALHFPEDIFTPPPPGKHGKTVDACSAAAIRAVCPVIAQNILDRGKEEDADD